MSATPIDLYYWPTPNGWKVTIMLEELGVPYAVKFVNIGAGDQFEPDFLAIAPNNRMPAIVDHDGPDGAPISVFESGAILLYLGRKYGQFYPAAERERVAVEEWLMWQMGGFGPMLGQNHHFNTYAPEDLPYAKKALHRRNAPPLRRAGPAPRGSPDYICGAYSRGRHGLRRWAYGWERSEDGIEEFPNVKRWLETMRRPAVERGLAVGKEEREKLKLATDQNARRFFSDSAPTGESVLAEQRPAPLWAIDASCSRQPTRRNVV